MLDNIVCLGSHWVCFFDEPFEGNWIVYAGDFDDGIPESVTGADEYW